MLTDDRNELINIFSKLKEEATDTLENDNVLPSSITHNGREVGIKIEFYKLLYHLHDIPVPAPPPKE